MCVVVDALVTGLTPREAQLGIVEPFLVQQLREAETQRGCGEVAPTMVLSEAGAAVVTDGERGEQEVVVVVVGLAEERRQAIAYLGAGASHGSSGGIGPHIVG